MAARFQSFEPEPGAMWWDWLPGTGRRAPRWRWGDQGVPNALCAMECTLRACREGGAGVSDKNLRQVTELTLWLSAAENADMALLRRTALCHAADIAAPKTEPRGLIACAERLLPTKLRKD